MSLLFLIFHWKILRVVDFQHKQQSGEKAMPRSCAARAWKFIWTTAKMLSTLMDLNLIWFHVRVKMLGKNSHHPYTFLVLFSEVSSELLWSWFGSLHLLHGSTEVEGMKMFGCGVQWDFCSCYVFQMTNSFTACAGQNLNTDVSCIYSVLVPSFQQFFL